MNVKFIIIIIIIISEKCKLWYSS